MMRGRWPIKNYENEKEKYDNGRSQMKNEKENMIKQWQTAKDALAQIQKKRRQETGIQMMTFEKTHND